MITVILEDQSGKELTRIFEESNDIYLIKDTDDPQYPYLSQLSTCEPDVFDSSDMNGIIRELDSLKRELNDEKHITHINHLIELAIRCRESSGLTLTFTPFERDK